MPARDEWKGKNMFNDLKWAVVDRLTPNGAMAIRKGKQ